MNAKLVRLLGASQTSYPHQLEMCYPRIVDKIVELWGTDGMEPYFNQLLIDERGGRHGFEAPVLMEIFALSNHYQSLKPAAGNVDNWADAAEINRLEKRSRQKG